MPSLKQSLQSFGLTEAEATIYLYLYGKAPESIWHIAKNTNFPRSTVYDVTRSLQEKGLLQKSIKYKSQEYSALPVDHLQTIIDTKHEEIDKLNQNLNTLQSQLPKSTTLTTQTDIRYFHGKQGLQQMMYNALSAKKEIVGYSIYGRAEIVGEKFMHRWVQDFHDKHLKDRCLINPTARTLAIIKKDVPKSTTGTVPAEGTVPISIPHQQTHDDIRVLPKDIINIKGDTMIYNHIVAVCYWRESEIVGFEIENQQYATMQKSLFETLWSSADPLESKS